MITTLNMSHTTLHIGPLKVSLTNVTHDHGVVGKLRHHGLMNPAVLTSECPAATRTLELVGVKQAMKFEPSVYNL